MKNYHEVIMQTELMKNSNNIQPMEMKITTHVEQQQQQILALSFQLFPNLSNQILI